MKASRRTHFLILIFTCFACFAMADIGLTHQLKQERAKVLLRIAELKSDSASHHQQVDSLQNLVISIDSKIMGSYDETVNRLASRNRDFGSDTKLIVYVALVAIGLAFLLLILIGIAQKRLVSSGNSGLVHVLKELLSDFVSSASYQDVSARKLLRVNLVVVLGLILMSFSVLAFLLRTL